MFKIVDQFILKSAKKRQPFCALFLALSLLLIFVGGNVARPTTAAPLLTCADITQIPASECQALQAFVTANPTIQLYESDQDKVRFIINVPSITVENGIISAEGLEAKITTIGAPALPYYHTLIALPPLANASIKVNTIKSAEQSVTELAPVPSISDSIDPSQLSSIDDIANVYAPDPTIYNVDALYPTALYHLSEPKYARDLRVVDLSVYPVRYNPQKGTVLIAQEIEIIVTFNGGRSAMGSYSAEPNQVLNGAAASNWHAFPTQSTAKTVLPTGRDTYKIEVKENGIYDVSYAELQAAGLDVANVDPNTFEMMYQGQPVAYQFIGDSDAQFENGESIRFFGWGFDGNRHTEQFVDRSVFWLWANGTPTRIGSQSNPTGYPTADFHVCQTVHSYDQIFNFTNTSLWDNFPNEPTSWFWNKFDSYVTTTQIITLTNPANTIDLAQVSAEIFTPARDSHRMNVTFNGVTSTQSWQNALDLNIGLEIPTNQLVNGNGNLLTLYADPVSSAGIALKQGPYFLKQLRITYPCLFIANDDQLIFDYATTGTHEFNVSGFSEGNANNVLVWDVSSRLQPKAVTMSSADVSSANGSYTYRIGSDQSATSRYIATTSTQLKNELAITQYIGQDISATGAEWIAITHAEFKSETDRLAVHRAQQSSLSTKVVDILDVTNQYGYGLATPGAIQEYLKYGLGNWTTKPQYLLLVGHATINPLQKPCAIQCRNSGPWDTAEKTFVVTDLLHKDRFMGLIPSDHTFATLIGTDEIPDLAVGRLAVQTMTEAKNIVDKIILYENNIDNSAPYLENTVFVADNISAAGDFCSENRMVENDYIPDNQTSTEFCLDSYISSYGNEAAPSQMRTELLEHLKNNGTGVLNYRGHGSVYGWASGLLIDGWADGLLNDTEATTVENNDKPMVIMSASSLDGNFAYNGVRSISEAFLFLGENRGSSGHWSSSGLGYSYESTILHTNFYKALYQEPTIPHRFGDATVYAKRAYVGDNTGDISQVYAFILQGDPAMEMPVGNDVATPTGVGLAQVETTSAAPTIIVMLLPILFGMSYLFAKKRRA